jgi:hypothetical protein
MEPENINSPLPSRGRDRNAFCRDHVSLEAPVVTAVLLGAGWCHRRSLRMPALAATAESAAGGMSFA